jgi:cell division protein FtsX
MQDIRKLTEQRQQAIYLLEELGFDCTILQGNQRTEQLALDDSVVVQAFRQQQLKQLQIALSKCTFAEQRATVDNVDD